MNRMVVGALVADRGFTEGVAGFSINIVRSWTEQLLTKRRAVDFCRVATALCPCA
jgi:hypothetical protein